MFYSFTYSAWVSASENIGFQFCVQGLFIISRQVYRNKHDISPVINNELRNVYWINLFITRFISTQNEQNTLTFSDKDAPW
jgi:hypothetical protein